jgi:hypothetical protein
MTEPRPHEPAHDPAATVPASAPGGGDARTDDRADPPAPGAVWAGDRLVTSEAERETVETVRSVSRLEESN